MSSSVKKVATLSVPSGILNFFFFFLIKNEAEALTGENLKVVWEWDEFSPLSWAVLLYNNINVHCAQSHF